MAGPVVQDRNLPQRRRRCRRHGAPPCSLNAFLSVWVMMIFLLDADISSSSPRRRRHWMMAGVVVMAQAQAVNDVQQPYSVPSATEGILPIALSIHSAASVNSGTSYESSPSYVFGGVDSTSTTDSGSSSTSTNKIVSNKNLRRTGRCPSRCGVGLGSAIRKVNAATNGCRQRCSLLPFLLTRVVFRTWECGTCADWEASYPGFDIAVTVAAPSDLQSAFFKAATKWSSVITGDLPSIDALQTGIKDYSECPAADIPNVIDDLYICGAVDYIDGAGVVLGQAGVEFSRKDNGLPIIGMMEFDEDDVRMMVERGIFDGVILHEMGHLFGFSRQSLNNKNLLSSTRAPCIYRADAKASLEWQSATGCPSTVPIPMEQGGGSGTFCSHWDETCLVGELMTGYVRNGGLEMSRMTVAALEDLGYAVNYTAADPFTTWNATCVQNLCGTGGGTGRTRRQQLRRQTQTQQQQDQRLLNLLPDAALPEASTITTPTTTNEEPRDKAEQAALNYGKQYLQSKRMDEASRTGVGSNPNLSYQADQVVYLLYLSDDGVVRSLIVESE